jgi:uncharacterized protein (PEP-CTERM system associated)
LSPLGANAQATDEPVATSGNIKRAVSIVPRVSLSETLTDNVRLTNVNQQSEQTTEISPGIRISIDGARLKTYFDYALTQVVYAQNSAANHSQNALNTFGTLEAVDNRVFVDFGGTISQQSIDAFGKQSASNASINANSTEVSSFNISPYVRGQLGDMADYEARYSQAVTNSDASSSAASDVRTVNGSVKLTSGRSASSLGWSSNLSRQTIDYSAGRSTETDQMNLGLSYAFSPQVKVFADAGTESNNFTTLDKQSYATNNVGLNWSPSELTKVTASRSQRSFGDAHSLSFEHRSARTVWKFTDSKDISTSPSQSGVTSLGTVYDLFFSQFASIEPEPIARAALVNAYLKSNGISPSGIVLSSFLTTAVSLQRRQELSVALLGLRDTLTFIVNQSESSRLDTLSTAIDNLSSSGTVKQAGFSVNYAHRLTPDYSLGVLLSQQSTSDSSGNQETTLRSVNVNLTGKVGKYASTTVGARRIVSDSTSAPYAETAVTGSLNVQF